jgi:hypothetical protein
MLGHQFMRGRGEEAVALWVLNSMVREKTIGGSGLCDRRREKVWVGLKLGRKVVRLLRKISKENGLVFQEGFGPKGALGFRIDF